MKRQILLLSIILSALHCMTLRGQGNNPISIYEGEQVIAVEFEYVNQPQDNFTMDWIRKEVESHFPIYPYSYYNRMQTIYYLSQIRNLSYVKSVDLVIVPLPESGLELIVEVTLSPTELEVKKPKNIFRDIRSFPVIYSKGNNFLTTTFSASEMMYNNNNAWFGHPSEMLSGNSMVCNPAGEGYTGWGEGYAMGGIYGITPIIPRWQLHIYGGASYLVSLSAGRELYWSRSRIYGDIEDAYFGVVGGKQLSESRNYSYNIQYGRKPFTLGNGWLITNMSANGYTRGALQLNARTAARRLFLASFRYGDRWGSITSRIFQVRPDEMARADSHTVINGIDIDYNNSDRIQVATSILHVPESRFGYDLADGKRYSREGLWVYDLRVFGNPLPDQSGVFFKTELGYQRNSNFDMKAFAGYAQIGYNFAGVYGQPSVSYRFAYFPGDDPDKKAYGRWDPLYSGGDGEQWVQGSNMSKIVQNSNEITHMIQLVHSPAAKLQTVTQFWLFMADRKNNIGGNPALSELKSKFYGSEIDLTLKYFHSYRWYFQLSSALSFPGDAIRKNICGAKTWFSLAFSVRYSL